MSTYRIPPSLSWLIRNRRVITGRIKLAADEKSKLEIHLQKANLFIHQHELISQQIEVLKKDLAAIDRSISLHEIPIDLTQLGDLRPHKNPYLFKRGVLTQSIFSAFSFRSKVWLSTTEVAVYVKSITRININDENFINLRDVVRNRLIGLAYQGKIDRINSGKLHKEGFWRQKPSFRVGITYSAIPLEDDYLASNPEKTLTSPK
ncbi:hypothetical protein [Ephemeroptericola cinctiostellae]|nr:hypothetical protein [Ephemeroptericola cinctiostellae]